MSPKNRYSIFLLVAALLVPVPAAAQYAVGVRPSDGALVRANDCIMCSFNASLASLGILPAIRGGTGFGTIGGGVILYGIDANNWGLLPAGTSGFLLQSGGTAAPRWTSPSAMETGSLVMTVNLFLTPAVGEVGYVSANNTVARARADATATVGAVGIYQGIAGQVAVGGAMQCLFDAGLILAAGDTVFLSDLTAGRCTNVAPTIVGRLVNFLGHLVDAAGYMSGAGSAQKIAWRPGVLVQL